MIYSSQLFRIASELSSDYFEVLKYFDYIIQHFQKDAKQYEEEIGSHPSAWEQKILRQKQENIKLIQEFVAQIKTNPEVLPIEHLSRIEQKKIFQQIPFNLDHLITIERLLKNPPALITEIFQKNRTYHRIINLLDRLIYLKQDFEMLQDLVTQNIIPEEKEIAEFLGVGQFGAVFKEKQGYVRKEFKLFESSIPLYKFLAKQNYAFYQQVPLVRIYDFQIKQQLGTERHFISKITEPIFSASVLMDQVTTADEYKKLLKQTQQTRFIEYRGTIKKVNAANFVALKHLFGQSTVLDLPNTSKKILLRDLHDDNFGIYLQKGTKENPDRLIHLDLDFLILTNPL